MSSGISPDNTDIENDAPDGEPVNESHKTPRPPKREGSPLRPIQDTAGEPKSENREDGNVPSKRTRLDKETRAEIRRKTEEAEKFVKDVPFCGNHYPKQTFDPVARAFLYLEKFEERQADTKGNFDEKSETACVICHGAVSPGNNETLINCHGQMSGEMEGSERIKVECRPFRACRSKFHQDCIMRYNSGDFFYQYAARPECQRRLLCPLHCCNSCNSSHHKQSAYQPDLIECALCLRSFHLSTCYPAGGRDLNVTIKVDGVICKFEMMICPAHYVPKINRRKKKHVSSLTKVKQEDATDVVPIAYTIKNHIKACFLQHCELNGRNPRSGLRECSKCVRSFHPECVEVGKINGNPIPEDICEFCICNDTIHINTPVIALWDNGNTFWLAKTKDWYSFPSRHRSNEKNYERLGYTVVEWISEQASQSPMMSIVPTYQVAPLIQSYIPLATSKLRELWKAAFNFHDENALKRCPPFFKKVALNGRTSKHFSKVRPKPIEFWETECECRDGLRCATETCTFKADSHECPPECAKRGDGCNNRQISSGWVNPKIELRKTANKGFGVFANDDIKEGEFLTEYVGELIDKNERAIRLSAISLARDFQANHYLMNLREGWAIDATTYGNISRYINHSCEPNCGSFPKFIFVGRHYKTERKTLLYEERNYVKAVKDIPKDDEITFSYSMEGTDNLPCCLCGTPSCDGNMTDKSSKKKNNREKDSKDPHGTEKKKGNRKQKDNTKKCRAKKLGHKVVGVRQNSSVHLLTSVSPLTAPKVETEMGSSSSLIVTPNEESQMVVNAVNELSPVSSVPPTRRSTLTITPPSASSLPAHGRNRRNKALKIEN